MPTPPVNIVPPSISPDPARPYEQLTASPGYWRTDSGGAITYTFQWFFQLRSDNSTYNLDPETTLGNTTYPWQSCTAWQSCTGCDVGVTVTATSAGLSATATASIGPIYGIPHPVEEPSLSGQPVVGGWIVLDPKPWRMQSPLEMTEVYPSARNPEIEISFQWQRSLDQQNWTNIPDGNGPMLCPGADLVGDYIRVRVTGQYTVFNRRGEFLCIQKRTITVPRVNQNNTVVDSFLGPILASPQPQPQPTPTPQPQPQPQPTPTPTPSPLPPPSHTPLITTVKITNTWDKALNFQVMEQGWKPIAISPTLNVAAGQTGSFAMPPGKPGELNFWIEVVGWNTPGVGTKSAVTPLPAAGTTLSYKFVPGWPARIVPS